jgi:hypothetical protein
MHGQQNIKILQEKINFNIICTIFMFQRDDFTLSVLTGNQFCQFVLVKKSWLKLIRKNFCPCYTVRMQRHKCAPAITTRPTPPSASIAKRNKRTTWSHLVSVNGDNLLFLSNQCLSCSLKASENVLLRSEDGRFLSWKNARMTSKKMKYTETYLNWEQITCTRKRQVYWRIQGKVSPTVKFGPHAEPCGWVWLLCAIIFELVF